MKEIYQAAERAFLRIPEPFRDKASLVVCDYYLRLGPGNSLKTPTGSGWSKRIIQDMWYRGEAVSFSKLAEGLLDGFNLVLDTEKLASNGAEILVVNEPNTGPLKGNWVRFLLNMSVAQRRSFEGLYEARWVQKINSQKPFLKNTPLAIQKRRLAAMINRSCQTILVDGESNGNNVSAVLEMARHLRQGGVVVICPEGEESKNLKRGKKEAGDLLFTLSRRLDMPIRPIGVWVFGDELHVRAGEELSFNCELDSGQKMADLTMIEIAKLIPASRRGVYNKTVRNLLLREKEGVC